MTSRILTAAALCLTLAAPALADSRQDVAAILLDMAPQCSKPSSQLTLQEATDCKTLIQGLNAFANARDQAALERPVRDAAPSAPPRSIITETAPADPVDTKCRANACLKIYPGQEGEFPYGSGRFR